MDEDTTQKILGAEEGRGDLLEDTSDGNFSLNGKTVLLFLSHDSLKYVVGSKKKPKTHVISLADVVGSRIEADEGQTGRVLLHVFAYPAKTPGCCDGKDAKITRQRAAYSFVVDRSGGKGADSAGSRALAERWHAALACTLRGVPPGTDGSWSAPAPRRLLVLVNPVGGTRRGLRLYERVLRPVLLEAGVNITLVVTEYQNHAARVLQELEPGAHDGVVVVGGDGLLAECMHGLHQRSAADRAALQGLPFAMFPAGSGNGLSASLLHGGGHGFSHLNAAVDAAKGWTHPLDLIELHTGGGREYTAFLSLTWGIIGDLDIESERWRWMGSARFTMGAVVRVLSLRRYPGRLSWLPAPEGAGGPAAATVPREGSRLPAFDQPVPDTWTVQEGEFLMVCVVNVTHISHDALLAPGAAFNDGVLQLLVVRAGVSKARLAAILLALEDGSHTRQPGLEVHRCTAFRIEPRGDKGIFSLDGESIEYGPVQGEVRPGLATVITRRQDRA